MKTTYLLLIVILLCPFLSPAQTNWIVYDTTNSPLPDNRTYKVVEDNGGNIWASTNDGLVKFDGVNWTVYDSVPGTSYALKNLFAMVYDDVNDWIYVSMPGKLIRFDGTTWTTWPHLGYSNENVIDSQGRVWMALYNLGVGMFDGTGFAYFDTTNSPIQSPFILDIEIDQNDNFWMIAGPGLTRFDGSTWTIYDSSNSPLPGIGVFGVGVDNNNLLWVHGDGPGMNQAFVYTFDGTAWTPFDTTICPLISAYSFIKPDAMNRMWIGTYGEGLQMIGPTACSTFTEFNSPLPTNYLHDIYITSAQTLWMTTPMNGLIRVDLPVGLNEMPDPEQSVIYPNPTGSDFTFTNFNGGTVSIYNALGKMVHSVIFPESELKSAEIDISFLDSGIYVIKTDTEMIKLMKQ